MPWAMVGIRPPAPSAERSEAGQPVDGAERSETGAAGRAERSETARPSDGPNGGRLGGGGAPIGGYREKEAGRPVGGPNGARRDNRLTGRSQARRGDQLAGPNGARRGKRKLTGWRAKGKGRRKRDGQGPGGARRGDLFADQGGDKQGPKGARRGGQNWRDGGATGKSTRRRDVVEAARAETERVRGSIPTWGEEKSKRPSVSKSRKKRLKSRAAMTSRRAECAQPVAFSRQFRLGCSVLFTCARQVALGLMRDQPNYFPRIPSIDRKPSFSAISIPAAFSPTTPWSAGLIPTPRATPARSVHRLSPFRATLPLPCRSAGGMLKFALGTRSASGYRQGPPLGFNCPGRPQKTTAGVAAISAPLAGKRR
jgi:hypothetical protein